MRKCDVGIMCLLAEASHDAGPPDETPVFLKRTKDCRNNEETKFRREEEAINSKRGRAFEIFDGRGYGLRIL